MSRLADLLTPENVLLDLDVANKRRLFEIIALESELRYDLTPTVTVDSLLARERLGSTGLGQGIAIPHGRIRGPLPLQPPHSGPHTHRRSGSRFW